MGTQTQARALAKGTGAALVRGKDREATTLTLYHNFDKQRLPLLLRQLQNMMPVGVSVVEAPSSGTAADLAKAEKHISALVDEKRELQKKLEALQAQVDNQRGKTPMGVEWISLTQAAKRLHLSYATLWRAHADGRLTTKTIGGKVRDQLVCDINTYRRKGRG